MNQKRPVYEILRDIKHQMPIHASTFSKCSNDCGNRARAGSPCKLCLKKELIEVVGEDAANEFYEKYEAARNAEYSLYEIESKVDVDG